MPKLAPLVVLGLLAAPLIGCTPQPKAPPRDIYEVTSPYGAPPPRIPGVGGSMPAAPLMPGLPPPQLSAPAPR
jgi:hypothetical protein